MNIVLENIILLVGVIGIGLVFVGWLSNKTTKTAIDGTLIHPKYGYYVPLYTFGTSAFFTVKSLQGKNLSLETALNGSILITLMLFLISTPILFGFVWLLKKRQRPKDHS